MPEFVNGLVAQMRGANYPAVSDGVVKASPTPLPPPSEQRRIVEILEQADALQRQRADADAQAARILPALFHQMFGDPATNPKQLPVSPLGKVVRSISGGTPLKSNSAFWNGEIPWVSPKDMTSIILSDAEDHITKDAVEQSATSIVPAGSVLMVVRSGILAHSTPVALAAVDLTLNQDMKAFLPDKQEIDSYYLLGWMLSSKQTLLSCVKRGATVHSIDSIKLQSLPFLKPKHESQKQFAVHFKSLLQMEAARKVAGEKLETLFSTLLHRAFSGELTALWREAHLKELLAEMEQQAKALKEAKDE